MSPSGIKCLVFRRREGVCSSHLRRANAAYLQAEQSRQGKRRSEPTFFAWGERAIIGILKEHEANILVVDLFHNKSRSELRAIDGLRRRHRMDGRARRTAAFKARSASRLR